ncbi:hypothetical protein B0H12DRAFT_1082095 [Mycena haematopus]|nr:hypothetical protein B0H12DRAFT_1082095 [Mycena haematopus]
MQNEISDIQDYFSMIQRISDGHHYDEDYFKHVSLLQLQDALVACYEEPQDRPKLPNTVRHAIDKVLCELAERMEHWDYSVLPFTAGDASNDDDNEHDTAIFSTLHARYARREIEYYKHAVPAADTRTSPRFSKRRLDNAERLESRVIRQRPFQNWLADLDLIGRGRILIFRKTGVATADCPSLDRRERWVLASAKDTDPQESMKVGLSGKKRRTQLATEVADEEDTVAAKKPKRAQLTSTTSATRRNEDGGHRTIHDLCLHIRPRYHLISPTDDSSDVEIVENPIAKLVV